MSNWTLRILFSKVDSMKVVVTGQVGLDKKVFLSRVVELARAQGFVADACNIGSMMYAEAPDVAPGRILDLPLARLTNLRRSVFKDVLAAASRAPNVIVNTHATFRWRHGLFYAFDYDQMQTLAPDLFIVLVDNVDRVHWRLTRDGHADHTLKDLMVWREEEMMATELLSQIVAWSPPGGPSRCGPCRGRSYICAIGQDDSTAGGVARLIFRPQVKKAYLSFPMTHINGDGGAADGAGSPQAAALAEIERFRREMKKHFTCFDPGDLEEKFLCKLALDAAQAGIRTIEAGPPGERARLDVGQLLDIIADIDGQIYARDFKLIDQSDMIISLIPALAGGQPAISSGVERELQHAHEATRDVFIIWQPKVDPSPFVTQTATRVFRSIQEAVSFFLAGGYIPAPKGGTLFP
jgi:adenylate kinase